MGPLPWRALLGVLLAVAPACARTEVQTDALASDASPDAPESASPADGSSDGASAPAVALTVAPDAVSGVSAVVSLSVSGADSVQLRYRERGAREELTTPLRAATQETMTEVLLGLRGGVRYELRATAFRASGASTTTAPTEFTVQGAAAQLPPVWVRPTMGPGPGMGPGRGAEPSTDDALLLNLQCSFGAPASWALLVDRAGRPLWYLRAEGASTLGFDVQRTGPGRFAVYDASTRSYREVDLQGAVLRRWASSSPLGLDGHDLAVLDTGEALGFALGTHAEDSRPYSPFGSAASPVLDFTVQRLSPSGAESALWSSWPGVTLAETAREQLAGPLEAPFDALHPDSLQAQPDGSVLLSLRNTDALYLVDPAAGRVRWRLGGPRSDWTFAGDPLGGFSRQHHARILPDGDLLVLDNGNGHTPPASRAAQYHLDEATRTASLVWQYPSPSAPHLFTPEGGSAERLPYGHTLLAWGRAGAVVEVDAEGATVWSASVPGCSVYRAFSLDRQTL